MTGITAASNKAKIARRVIEVLDFFDDHHREATVMDIVRRYGRPQSSTSELLSSLVELGLLAKEPWTRTYSLTPRAALLGTSGQNDAVRDGRFIRLIDRLAAQTGLGVGLFAIAGLNAQLISWRSPSPSERGPFSGALEPLCHSATGWLLLSTIERERSKTMVRRLNAEAEDDAKFSCSEMTARIDTCRQDGHVFGPAGFGTACEALSALVPVEIADQPLAIAIQYSAADKVNEASLLQSVNYAMHHCLTAPEPAQLAEFSSAA
ncbi:MAG: helix-turn-helix domain-containing protein [Novosphingobium sp.]|nr:helix-turn-helix domain-containing protein [Novosphingobium sp.]